jgi:hypothetical protein
MSDGPPPPTWGVTQSNRRLGTPGTPSRIPRSSIRRRGKLAASGGAASGSGAGLVRCADYQQLLRSSRHASWHIASSRPLDRDRSCFIPSTRHWIATCPHRFVRASPHVGRPALLPAASDGSTSAARRPGARAPIPCLSPSQGEPRWPWSRCVPCVSPFSKTTCRATRHKSRPADRGALRSGSRKRDASRTSKQLQQPRTENASTPAEPPRPEHSAAGDANGTICCSIICRHYSTGVKTSAVLYSTSPS